MFELHFNAKLLMDVLSEMLRRVDTAMLSTCATEGKHEVGETALYVACNVHVGQGENVFEKNGDFAIFFKKVNDGLV